MGYFSNGTEGDYYEDEYCSRCVHQNGPDGKSGCAVMMAHILYAYKLCNSKCEGADMLDMMIPRSKDRLSNQQCAMFHEGKPVEEVNVFPNGIPDYLKGWAAKHGLK